MGEMYMIVCIPGAVEKGSVVVAMATVSLVKAAMVGVAMGVAMAVV